MSDKPRFIASDGKSVASHLTAKPKDLRQFVIILNNKKCFVCVDKILHDFNFVKSRGYFIDDPEVQEEDFETLIATILDSEFDKNLVFEVHISANIVKYTFPLVLPKTSQ